MTMVTRTLSQANGHRASANSAVRAYLHALKRGERPTLPENAGEWAPLLSAVEQIIKQLPSDLKILDRVFVSLINTGKFPGLAELLADDNGGSAPAGIEPNKALLFPELPGEVMLPHELAREASPWLDAYIKYSVRVSPEGYEDFHEACGLWVLFRHTSGAVRSSTSRTCLCLDS